MEIPESSETLDAQNPDAKTLEEGSRSGGLFGLSENCVGLGSFAEVSGEENGERVEVEVTDTDDGVGVENVEVSMGKTMEGAGGEFEVLDFDAIVGSGKNCDDGIEMDCLLNDGVDGQVGDQGASEEGQEVGLDGNWSEEGVQKIVAEEGVKLNADLELEVGDPDGKIEVTGGGISLFVEFNVPSSGISLDHINEADNYEFLTSEDNLKEAENEEEEEEEMVDNKECKFLAGDIVWVKTKNKTWWPGKIYDPSDAPKHAAKSDQRHCLIVGYFGCSHVAWCSPSQLKPFCENFEQMLRQYKSRSFTGAVEKALYEFGKCVQSEMACSCFLKESQLSVDSFGTKEEHVSAPELSVDSFGTKEEHVSAPERNFRDLGKFSVLEFEPVNFLELIKHLAHNVSIPGMLELTVAENRVAAFYCSMGHGQLPLHQLIERSDTEDIVGDSKGAGKKINGYIEDPNPGLLKLLGEDVNVALKNSKDDLAGAVVSGDLTSGSRKRLEDEGSELRKCGDEVQGLDNNVMDSLSEKEVSLLGSPENKVSSLENGEGVIEGKIDKGPELRERKKSKYLSYPYINLERKGVPDGSEGPANGLEEAVNAPSIVKCSGKKTLKKWSRKLNASGNLELVNASSAELLSELRLTALDCLYPHENEKFDSIEWFFYRYRVSLYHNEFNGEMPSTRVVVQMNDMGAENPSPVAKSEPKKRKRKEKAILRPSEAGITPSVQDVKGQSGTLGISSPIIEVKPVRKRRKKEKDSGSKTKPLSGPSDVNVSIAHGEPEGKKDSASNTKPLSDPSDVNVSIAHGEPEEKKREDGATSVCLQTPGIPDLNGSNSMPSMAVEGSQAMNNLAFEAKPEPKKRKRKQKNTTVSSHTQISAGIVDANANIERGSLVIGLQSVVPPIINGNNVQVMGPPSVNANTAKPGFLTKNPQDIGLLPTDGKPVQKRRRRKEKTTPVQPMTNLAAGIPDLNGAGAEPSALGEAVQGTNCLPPQVKPERKRRKKKGEPVHIPDISMGYGRAEANGDAPGTALLLTFAQGVTLPSKEVLVATFCRFGSLKESETQVLQDSLSASVVFTKSSDAMEAFRSLEKSNPLGATIVNYRLHHLPAAPRAAEQDRNLLKPVASQPKEGYKVAAKPSSSEAPPLDFIKQNLKMMTSMLETAGDNLSPDMRAKLECEIKALMTKISTMGGSTSS